MGPGGGGPGQGTGRGWMEGAWSGARGGLEEDVTQPGRPLLTWPREQAGTGAGSAGRSTLQGGRVESWFLRETAQKNAQGSNGSP